MKIKYFLRNKILKKQLFSDLVAPNFFFWYFFENSNLMFHEFLSTITDVSEIKYNLLYDNFPYFNFNTKNKVLFILIQSFGKDF